MSKKSKATAREKRLNKKRAIKMANKAKYQAWAKEGQNSKSKRSRRVGKQKRLAKSFSHFPGHCGNLACKKCYPIKIAA